MPLKSFFKRFEVFYPYDQCGLTMKIKVVARVIFIKLFNSFVYPDISLLDYMKSLKGLKSDQEFLNQYEASKNGFEIIWDSKPRETQGQVESFYSEHDKDVWRQVYLSKYGIHKRKFVLMAADLISNYSKDKNIKILDYGCGCGVYGHYLAKKGCKDITLADIESSTFQFVQNVFGKKFKYIKIDNQQPIKENYDVILLIDCLAHAFNPFEAAKHAFDHLKKKGLLIVYYEKGVECTHLSTAGQQREKTMNYIYEHCQCLKKRPSFY